MSNAHKEIWTSPTTKAAVPSEPLSQDAKKLLTGGVASSQPPKPGQDAILRYYRRHPTLHQIPGRIARDFAAIQWTVSRGVGRGGKSVRRKDIERMDWRKHHATLAKAKADGDAEALTDDPVIDFIEEGNTVLSGYECREVMALHLELVGDAIAWKERNAFGMPIRYWPIPATWVREMPWIGSSVYRIDIQGSSALVDALELIRIRMPDPYDPYGRGVGKAEALSEELDTEEYTAAFVKAFFHNNATPTGILTFDGANEEQMDALEIRWDAKHRGSNRAHRIHFLNQEAQFHDLGQSFKDMDVVNLRSETRDITRETWGLPPEIVGQLESSNRATIEAAEDIYARWILVPLAERWRRALQAQVVPDFDERKILSYESPVPDDREYRLKVMTAQPAAFTRAEWKIEAGLEPVEGVDDVYVMPNTVMERPADGSPPEPFFRPQPPQPSAAMVRESIEGYRAKAAGIDLSDIDAVMRATASEILAEPVREEWPDWIEEWGQQALEQVGADVVFNRTDPKTLRFIEEASGTRITMINDTTRDAVRAVLSEGVEAGEGHRELAKRIQDVFSDASYRRATLISRTEVTRAANFATVRAYEQAGIGLKEWISTKDGRARDDHLAMDGVIVDINSPFVLPDGSMGEAPGDTGNPAQDCNCRCTTGAVVPGLSRSVDDRTAVWKSFDRGILPWERAIENAYREGFQKQEQAVLEVLRRLSEDRGRS